MDRVRDGIVYRKSTRCLHFYEWNPQPFHPALQRGNTVTGLVRQSCRTCAPPLVERADKLIRRKHPEIGQCQSVGETEESRAMTMIAPD